MAVRFAITSEKMWNEVISVLLSLGYYLNIPYFKGNYIVVNSRVAVGKRLLRGLMSNSSYTFYHFKTNEIETEIKQEVALDNL